MYVYGQPHGDVKDVSKGIFKINEKNVEYRYLGYSYE
jgi:hypothetical protein